MFDLLGWLLVSVVCIVIVDLFVLEVFDVVVFVVGKLMVIAWCMCVVGGD